MKTSIFLGIVILLIAGYFPVTAAAQTSTTQTQSGNRVRDPAKIKYNYRMEQSFKQMKWSQIYFESFKKTEEISYLNLAARHCLNAISSFHQTQNLLSKTTRFHYQTKKKKMAACQFYNTLQLASHHLAVEHHLKPADQKVCSF